MLTGKAFQRSIFLTLGDVLIKENFRPNNFKQDVI